MSSSAVKGSVRRKGHEPHAFVSEKKKKKLGDDGSDLDLDISSDIKGIISALQQIKQKAQKDDQKKNEETIGSAVVEIRSMLDDAKQRIDKERQSLLKALLKSSKECENSLKNELVKFQTEHEAYHKVKTAHLQAYKDIFAKYEEEKEKLFARYEQQRKKEKSALAELEKICTEKIANAEESLKKKNQDDKSFSILRKTLGSFLDNASDDDFEVDE